MANNILMPDYVELQKKNYSGFVVIGAGLPRTGTMSLRAALGILLDGACHHMMDVFSGTNSVYYRPIYIILCLIILISHQQLMFVF